MMLSKLLAATDRTKFEPAVLSLLPPGPVGSKIRNLGIAVHSLDAQRGRLPLSAAPRLSRLAGVMRPNIVQGWMYHGNLVASLVAFLASCPAFWSIRCTIVPEGTPGRRLATLGIRAGAALSWHPRAIVFNAKASVGAHARVGYSTERAVVIPNGFDTFRFRPRPDSGPRLRARLNIPADAPVIGIVARDHPVKDIPTFVAAARRFGVADPNAHFVLVGRGLTPHKAELREARLHALGEREDVADIVAGFDLFCSSSLSEGFSNAVGEAMASGVPCVVTDVGDSAYLVGETGLVVPPGDPRALVDAWTRLLRHPSEREQMGAAARNRIVQEFGIEAVARRYYQVYLAERSRTALKEPQRN